MAERNGQDDHSRQKPEASRERDDERLRARLNTLSSALDAQNVADKAAEAAKREPVRILPGSIGNAMSSCRSRLE